MSFGAVFAVGTVSVFDCLFWIFVWEKLYLQLIRGQLFHSIEFAKCLLVIRFESLPIVIKLI